MVLLLKLNQLILWLKHQPLLQKLKKLLLTLLIVGYWVAMCIELNVRGLLFYWRLRGEKWMKLKIT